MIAFDLKCINGHLFEGWFEDSRAYETQKEKNLISCPVCDTTEVCKVLSTFAIKKGPKSDLNAPVSQAQMAEFGRKVVDYVEKNFDNVGCEFTREALKIHYGVSEPRNIRGVSTPEEEKVLKQEGIEYIKLPMPVSDSDNPPETEN
jgi:hypothetical protein